LVKDGTLSKRWHSHSPFRWTVSETVDWKDQGAETSVAGVTLLSRDHVDGVGAHASNIFRQEHSFLCSSYRFFMDSLYFAFFAQPYYRTTACVCPSFSLFLLKITSPRELGVEVGDTHWITNVESIGDELSVKSEARRETTGGCDYATLKRNNRVTQKCVQLFITLLTKF
jgi:hypothetical protein